MPPKLYLAAMIVLPLFLGSGATFSAISYFTGQSINMNSVVVVMVAIVGLGTGIVNLWKLINRFER